MRELYLKFLSTSCIDWHIHHDVYYKGMERTQIYLPKMQREKLRKMAQKKKITVSEVIRNMIKETLKVKNPSLAQKKEKLADIAKRINAMNKKGPKDLASNIDKYIYGRKK